MSLDAEFETAVGDFALTGSVHVAAGKTAVVVGPNGAGKTTLLSAIAGLAPVIRGHIELAGTPVHTRPAHERGVGYLHQDNLLFPHLDALDNVAFGLRAAGRGRRAARSQAREWLDRVDAAELAHLRPTELSGGQAKRVALARTLAPGPELLLLDEPLAALDRESRVAVRRLIAELDVTRMVVSHDAVDTRLLADQIVAVEAGAAGPAERAPFTTNLVRGTAAGTEVRAASGATLVTVDAHTGEVLLAFEPEAVTLSDERPHSSARNVWPTTVTDVADEGATVRVALGEPVPANALITAASASRLGLRPGSRCWASVKATELSAVVI